MDDNAQDPLEDLIHMVQILMEEPDKISLLQKHGAIVTRNYFIFTCLGGCLETYAINSINRDIYLLNHIDSIPETGTPVTDEEEIVCIIESLLEFVETTPDICNKDEFFMERLNPKNYTPGSCFSPC